MGIVRKSLDPTVDRSKGVEVHLAGDALVVQGQIPLDLEISFTGQSGERHPFGALRDWTAGELFSSVWVFHAAVATPLNDWSAGFFTGSPLVLVAYRMAGARPIFADVSTPRPQMVRVVEAGINSALYRAEERRTPGALATGVFTNATTTIFNPFSNPAATLGHYAIRVFALRYSVAGNTTIAAAGDLAVTFSWGGGQGYQDTIYLPAASANVFGGYSSPIMRFGSNGIRSDTVDLPLSAIISAQIMTGALTVQALYGYDRVA